ncbi:MAG: tetratricopeptide repeat protein [Deltaproteobacteria bacterium]|nr:MAG: tetratricopeptide repeat protein [Deltaproteobacteria bacterium]
MILWYNVEKAVGQLHLKLLGTLDIRWGTQDIEGFPTDKIRALLVYLCLEPRSHRRDVLASLLWSNWESKEAKKNLRQSLHRLKQTLNKVEEGLAEQLLHVTRQDVQISPELIDSDVVELEATLEHWEAKHWEGLYTNASALEELVALVDSYGGELLVGFDLSEEPVFDDWLRHKRETLRTHIVTLLRHLVEAYQVRHDYETADRLLLRWLELEPWSEGAHRSRMRVLALQGQRSAALAQYHTCVEILLTEFQADPTDETVELYDQIHYEEVGGERPADAEILHNFPAETTLFVGREPSLQELLELLSRDNKRLITLMGPGGTGKTRLAVEVCRRLVQGSHPFVDGVFRISLNSLNKPERFPATLGQQMGLAPQASGDWESQLFDFMRSRCLLLLLDNFEDILPARSFLQSLLEKAPYIKVLVTSRIALNVSSEHRYVVKGLLPSGAVQLFLQRAEQVGSEIEHEEDFRAIETLCQHVEYLPLAIELAASWTRMMDVNSIVEEVQSDIDFLQSDWGDLPERHQSIRNVLNYSLSLLKPEEQKGLAQLSLFRGSFSLKAARAIAGCSVRMLARCTDHALVQRSPENRYSLHALLRQFLESLRLEQGQEAVLQQKYGSFFLELLATETSKFLGGTSTSAMQQIQLEMENIRQAWILAMEAHYYEGLSQAADDFALVWTHTGLLEEGCELFEAVVESLQQHPSGSIPPEKRDEYLSLFQVHQAQFLSEMGKPQRVATLTENVLHASAASSPSLAAHANNARGEAHIHLAEYPEAIECFERSIALSEHSPRWERKSHAFARLGYIFFLLGDYEKALDMLEDGLSLDRLHNFQAGVAKKLNLSSFCYKEIGQLERAYDCSKQAISVARELRSRADEGRYLNNCGVILLHKERNGEALEHYMEARQIFAEMGLQINELTANANVGIMHWHEGRFHLAVQCLRQTIEGYEALGSFGKAGMMRANLGQILRDMGRFAEAEEHIRHSLEHNRKHQHKVEEGRVLAMLGELKVYSGDMEEALSLLQEGTALLREYNSKIELVMALLLYAELLWEQGEVEAARATNQEAMAGAKELEHSVYTFRAVALLAQIVAHDGRRDEAIEMLEQHLTTEALPLASKTLLLESLWRVRQKAQDKDLATQALRTLCLRIPSVRNQRRLELHLAS